MNSVLLVRGITALNFTRNAKHRGELAEPVPASVLYDFDSWQVKPYTSVSFILYLFIFCYELWMVIICVHL